jgi:hypothetical protein
MTHLACARATVQMDETALTTSISSFMLLAVQLVAITLIRTRPTSPEARGRGKGPWVDKAVIKKSEFYSIAIALLVGVCGYG